MSEKPKKITLSNNLNVFLLKETNLPYVRYELLIPMGSSKDPKGKEGLSYLVSEILSRGTKEHNASELAVLLENLGSKFTTITSRDYSAYSAETLSWNHDKLLKIFSDIVSQPAFLKKEFDWTKNQSLSKIQKLPEKASLFTNRVFYSSIFQFENYKHNIKGSIQSLNNIQSSDVIEHYKKYLVPQNAILGITGQYPHDIKKKLETAFSEWKETKYKENKIKKKNIFSSLFKKKKSPSKIKNKIQPSEELQILIVHKKGQVQSNIRMGNRKHPVFRSSPDYLDVQIANIILGGSGIESRLANEIRVKNGLTYGVYSDILPLMHDGIIRISTPTRLNVTRQAVDLILDTTEFFYKNGVSKDEVEKAKKNYKINLLSQLETAEDRLFRQMFLNMHGLPYDLPSLNRNLNRIKTKHINIAIKKYFNPYQVNFIIFTDFDEIKKQFENISKIKIKDFNEFL